MWGRPGLPGPSFCNLVPRFFSLAWEKAREKALGTRLLLLDAALFPTRWRDQIVKKTMFQLRFTDRTGRSFLIDH